MSTIAAAAPAPTRILHATYQHLVAYTGAGGEQSLVTIVTAISPSSSRPSPSHAEQEKKKDEEATHNHNSTTALGYETINVLSIAPAPGTSISLLALGGQHLAVGLLKSSVMVKKKGCGIEGGGGGPTMVQFYSLFHHHLQKNVKEVDYSAPILQLCLNQQFAAMLLEDNQGKGKASPRVLLHAIDNNNDGNDGKDKSHCKKYHPSEVANVFRKQQWFGGAGEKSEKDRGERQWYINLYVSLFSHTHTYPIFS